MSSDKLHVSAVDLVPAEGVSESELLSMAYALEKKSEHPLAKAVLLRVRKLGFPQLM